MKTLRTLLALLLVIPICVPAAQNTSTHLPAHPVSPIKMRTLEWNTYLDRVEGAWMGKMIGVTFGAPWEFRNQGVPVGFDVTDWPLSPSHMRDYLARAATEN